MTDPTDPAPRDPMPFRVQPELPEALSALRPLSENLWWTWQRDAFDLFERIDPQGFARSAHNPVALLAEADTRRLAELAADPDYRARLHLLRERMEAELVPAEGRPVAYFCAEFGLHESVPLYSGGLGVLAGDTLKSASDLGVPTVAVGLAYSEGYFQQSIDRDGWQQEAYPRTAFERTAMQRVMRDGAPLEFTVEMGSRVVRVQALSLAVGRVPLYLMTTDLDGAPDEDRALTSRLYGGDHRMRIQQEVLLGVGGVRLLDALGVDPAGYHMNEGHSAFLTLEQTSRIMRSREMEWEPARRVASSCNLFTTHTPVPAGHDAFALDLAREFLAPLATTYGVDLETLIDVGRDGPGDDAQVSMTLIGLRMARYCNGVSRLHGDVSRRMMQHEWPHLDVNDVPITSVTNGVHHATWLAPEWERSFEQAFGREWLTQARLTCARDAWAEVRKLPLAKFASTRRDLRGRLIAALRHRVLADAERRDQAADGQRLASALDPEVLTIGFARRFATYKRATLLFRDVERLKRIILHSDRPVQVVFAGKAHPRDDQGKQFIQDVFRHTTDPSLAGRLVFLDGYDMEMGRLLTQGVDVWLNTPRRPHEASGTSGMKAAMNGALNLSILDGWWCEAHRGDNGWAFGRTEVMEDEEEQDAFDAAALYDLLENEVAPRFYERDEDGFSSAWATMVKESIATLSGAFSSVRMMADYRDRFYAAMRTTDEEIRTHGPDFVREHLDWWSWVGEHWDDVQITDVNAALDAPVDEGATIPVEVFAQSEPIPADQLRVDVLSGPLEDDGTLRNPSVTVASFQDSHEGRHRFTAEVVAERTGRLGMSVRLRPHREGAARVQAPTLVRWARPDGSRDAAPVF